MTLRKRTNKKGGDFFANLSDNANNLLANALNLKRGGCKSYADVNSSYMLTDEKAVVGGSMRKNNRRGGCTSYADVNSSYMISDEKTSCGGGRARNYKKRGGDVTALLMNLMDRLPGTSTTAAPVAPVQNQLLPEQNVKQPQVEQQQQKQQVQAPASASTPAPASTPVAEVKTGGKRCNNRRGGCGCSASTSSLKGGYVELAPFAAATALLAARYVADLDDMNFNYKTFSKSLSKSVSKPKTASKSVSKPKTASKSVSKPKTASKSVSKPKTASKTKTIKRY